MRTKEEILTEFKALQHQVWEADAKMKKLSDEYCEACNIKVGDTVATDDIIGIKWDYIVVHKVSMCSDGNLLIQGRHISTPVTTVVAPNGFKKLK